MSNSDMWFWAMVVGCPAVGFFAGYFGSRPVWVRDIYGRSTLVRPELRTIQPDPNIVASNIQSMSDIQKQVYINNLGKRD